jgi:16S rRNA G966 N2-methylase RsmD
MPKRRGRAPDESTRFSDIDVSRWKEYDDVLTDSLWLFDARGRGNGHANTYHGNYIPQIATQVLTRYSRGGEVVVDLFLGSGTTAIEAAALGRRSIGVELQGRVAAGVRAKLRGVAAPGTAAVITADSASESAREKVRTRLHAWGEEHAQLVVLHPPYDDIIRFSDAPADLSNCDSTDDFLERFGRVARNAFALLEPGRFAVLVIGDKYAGGELVPLGFRCMERMTDAGFKTKSIVVKNIEGNERGKGRTQNLWRYRALKGGFYIFKHEYVMVFFKPR